MSFPWGLYVQLAGELIDLRGTLIPEAYLRSAMSRSYYGVYGIAEGFLRRKSVILPPRDVHTSVRKHYHSSGNLTERQIGNFLARLWKERKDADYAAGAIVDLKRATTAHELGIRALGKLRDLDAI